MAKKIELDMGPKLSKHSDRIMKMVWVIMGTAIVVAVITVIIMLMLFNKLPF